MHRLPFKAETEEDLLRISTEFAQRLRRNECHRSATERRTHGQDCECLPPAINCQHHAKKCEGGGERPRHNGSHHGEDKEYETDCPREPCVRLVGSTPWHLVLTKQHLCLPVAGVSKIRRIESFDESWVDDDPG